MVWLVALCLSVFVAAHYSRPQLAFVILAAWWAGEQLLLRRGIVIARGAAVAPKFTWDWFSSQPTGRLSFLPQLLRLFSRSDEAAETLLYQKISELRAESELTDAEQRWLERLKDLAELRGMVFGQPLKGKKGLRQGFAYQVRASDKERDSHPRFSDEVSVQDITESAIVMADLYWKLYDTASGTFADLAPIAKKLSADIFQAPFDAQKSRPTFEHLTDSMQRERGVPFLVLNLMRQGDHEGARRLTAHLLTMEGEMDEEVRSSLYWLSELHWFTQERKGPIGDFEASIRYLYHLCFTNPDRAGFLEIDSQFFSQFETVNELAREGYLFKESLIEKILLLWKEYDGYFDDFFRAVLESMTQRKSKIYDERESWERFWKREREEFSRDYLYVVEGNLFYAGGHYEDACAYYEKALSVNPKMRSALLNVLFCYAKLKRWDRHALMVEKVTAEASLYPASLSVIGNSYLLLGEEAKAETYYEELKGVPGWEKKTEYYKSTFCFENNLLPEALKYAEAAYRANPNDSSVSYHLSLCYNALGMKDRALEMLEQVQGTPDLQWLNYYRFTLERDAGRNEDASETLLRIPTDYFQDPDEFEAALDFARSQKDLNLLRHLRARGK